MQELASHFFAAVNFLYALFFGGPLDGTAWDVRVKEDRFFAWSSRRDTLLFTGGRLVVAGQTAEGLPSPVYEAAREEEGSTAFAAVMKGPAGGRFEWVGRAEGRRISGQLFVRQPDGRLKAFRFSGRRREA